MDNYENDKIRIPNETYCPSKKIQFNSSSNIPRTINNINNIISINSNANIINIYANQNNPSSISITNSNIEQNLNLNIFSQDNSSEEGVTISPIKSIITSASSKPPTLIQPQCKLEKFLPPKTSNFHKTLVLDLDETLIHSYFDCDSPRPADLSYDILIENKKIHVNSIVRPGAQDFLENVSTIFEIVIFTASLSEYANPLLDFVDKNKKCKYRLYREHCCSFSNGFTNSFTKDLKKLDRDMKCLIIIDNNPKSYMLNKENGVPIKTWVEDINDRELYRLIPYLLFLGNEKVKDVRPFLKQVNSGNILNYDKFDKIIMKYNIEIEKKQKEENNSNNNNNNNNLVNFYNNNINNISTNNKENKSYNEENNNVNNTSTNNKGNKYNNDNINININNNSIIKENKTNIFEQSNNNLMVKDNKKLIEYSYNIHYNNNSKNMEKKLKKNPSLNNDNESQIQNNYNDKIIENNIKINNKQYNNNDVKINNENNIKSKNNKSFNNIINENINSNKKNKDNENSTENKNIMNEKKNIAKEINKNKSSKDMSNYINLNPNNKHNLIIQKEIDKNYKINEKNSKNINNSLNKSNNNINKENHNNNIIREKNNIPIKRKDKDKSIRENQNNVKRDDSSQNINKRNYSVTNKNNYLCNSNQNKNINKRYEKKDMPCRIKYDMREINNNFKKENNRYDCIFKDEDNQETDEPNISNNNIIQREVKNNNNHIFGYNSTQEIDSFGFNKNENQNSKLNIHTAKSSCNINSFKNNFIDLNNNKNKFDNKIDENEIINKVRKEIKIDIINNFRPSADLLNEVMTNINQANSLKSSSNSVNKNIQLSEENQEKTIINDDIEEEEKNEKEKDNYGDQQLFDDIDQDLNDSNVIINNNKNNDDDDNNNINKEIKEDFNQIKKKYFEADDALEYNKNMEKEKLIVLNNENESNTINAKSSFNRNNRKLNKNFFNKSKPYPINNNKRDLRLGNKINRNSPFINQYQLGKSNVHNHNNFLQTSKKNVSKELLNYSSRKKNEINNLSSSNYKLFKEKTKSNLHLKYNSYNNKEIIDSFLTKNKPIIKHNSNVFHFSNNQFNPKTNRNKNTINENQKISLSKNNNYLNNLKNISGIKSNNFCITKNTEKRIIPLSNRENILLFNNSTSKIKRPTSCANRKTDKIKYNGNNKILKFANQGKKIYLKSSNKTNINTENINNININITEKVNNSKENIQYKNNNNKSQINITNKNNIINSPYTIISPSGNVITDIFFVRNLGNKTVKTTKGDIKFNNLYEDKEENQKRFPSAMNNKLTKNNNNII